MKQIVQNYKTGELKLIETPPPLLKPGGVLVRNANSVVSLGTEKMLIEFASKSLLGKARARSDLTRQVIDLARRERILKAYREAQNRLDVLSPLGYSSAGVVVGVGEGVNEFKVGDRVSCFRSGFASHAEIIFVPQNLCVKIPDNVDFESAAFGTVGAIALHAIRLCELSLGESIAIIGLGLLGQLAVQLAKASGYRVFGMDTNDEKVSLAKKRGADDGIVVTGKGDTVSAAKAFSDGYGFDAVLILATTSTSQPLKIAAEISRERGKIVAPGMVKLDIPREAFYQKELSLVVSRATGPGFGDTSYELKGSDYPYPHVRWTERRNVQEFLELVAKGKVELQPLITRRFRLDDAEEAYKAIMEDASGKHISVLIGYDFEEKKDLVTRIQLKEKTAEAKDTVNVGLIGAGAFALTTILPSIRKLPSVNLKAVATATGASARHTADKFGFEYCTTDYQEILNDQDVNCVLIATRHNLHAKLTVEALNCGKDVFVEKPLALSRSELEEIVATYDENQGRLMVGFNRRFSTFSLKAKELVAEIKEPIVINYRVNAGFIPKDSWVHDPLEGGGRILGEVCHFVDLAQFLTGSPPAKVSAEVLSNAGVYAPYENVAITITFKNGSIASIIYAASGSKSFPRERVEIFGGGCVCVIDDFKSLVFTQGSRKKEMKTIGRDMGHKAQFSAFFSAIQRGEKLPVDFEEYIYSSLATLGIEESIAKGIAIEIKLESDLRV